MEWIAKNFAVASAVAVLGAASASVVFLVGYLSVFDWTLIWLVEYSDLTKLFLIFGALLSLVSAFIVSFVSNLMEDVSLLTKLSAVGAISAILLIFLGIDVYHDSQAQNGLAFWHAEGAFCWVMFLFTLFMIFEMRDKLARGDWRLIWSIIMLITLTIGISGGVYGNFVKLGVQHSVTIWGKHEEFQNARIIMWFSHHIAFYTEKKVIVLPTADVAQMELVHTDQNAQR